MDIPSSDRDVEMNLEPNSSSIGVKTSKKAYTELSLRQKCELLRFAECHSERKTAEQFGVSKTTVNKIKKRKCEYLDRLSKENDEMSRKKRASPYDMINELTLNWYLKMRGLNVRPSGPMLQQIALVFAAELDLPEFKASSGWLESFKARNKITSKTLTGDRRRTEQKYEFSFSEFVGSYEPQNIFSANECALLFKAMPDTCMEKVPAKERLTILFCASAMGEKLRPFVVGKSKTPKCFKNIQAAQLPITWRSHRQSWMSSELFAEWLNSVNSIMKEQKRSILMLVDNSPSHYPMESLSNVALKILPPESTATLQPLENGVIRAFKANYRKLLLKEIVRRCEGDVIRLGLKEASNVHVLDAITWIIDGWNAVRPETIQQSFKKSGCAFREDVMKIVPEESDSTFPDFENFSAFIECDRNMVTSELCDTKELLSAFKSLKNVASESDSDEEVTKGCDDNDKVISDREAFEMLEKIQSQYVRYSCPEILESVYQAKKVVGERLYSSIQSTKDKLKSPNQDVTS